ncbi:MAG: sulfatase [Anaerolineae bacterium]|nr:sulfatase [Anaerolineae bacterium]
MNKPNIVLLTIDALRADILGCYGRVPSLTPNLDRLAETGIRFTQAITGGTWTQAAFPVLLTSSHAAAYGGCLGRLHPGRPSPIAALAEHGYTTAGFSTNPHLSRATGYDRGFCHFADLVPSESDPWLRSVKGGQRLLRASLTHHLLRLFGRRMRPARLYVSAAETTAAVCRWLEGAAPPFFAWAHYMDVHWPYHIEHELVEPDEIAQAWRDLGVMHGLGAKGDQPLTVAQQERFVRLYARALQYIDAEIGRLFACLDHLPHSSETIVMVTSDHGEEFFDHHRWGHWESNLYDESIRVPLLVRTPGCTAGQVIKHQVRTLDLMPTILDLCGCPPPSGVEGVSMAPLWNGDPTGYVVSEAVCEMLRDEWHRIAIRTESFKYIWDNRGPDRCALYDLQADPAELDDVSRQHPDVVEHSRARVDAHLQHVAQTATVDALPDLELDAEVIRRLQDLGYIS